jgi:hypothetical protein
MGLTDMVDSKIQEITKKMDRDQAQAPAGSSQQH